MPTPSDQRQALGTEQLRIAIARGGVGHRVELRLAERRFGRAHRSCLAQSARRGRRRSARCVNGLSVDAILAHQLQRAERVHRRAAAIGLTLRADRPRQARTQGEVGAQIVVAADHERAARRFARGPVRAGTRHRGTGRSRPRHSRTSRTVRARGASSRPRRRPWLLCAAISSSVSGSTLGGLLVALLFGGRILALIHGRDGLFGGALLALGSERVATENH